MTTAKSKHPAILILGAPGAGKGTLGKTLAAIPRFFHCACGDVFRSLDTRTSLGQEFVEYSSRGELVPDELTIKLWKAKIDNWQDSHLYKPDIDVLVLDGIPRNLAQAQMLEKHLTIHYVYHLSCPNRDELARRMRKRALKEGRPDDASNSVIEHRIHTYEEETKPLIDYYSEQKVYNINANNTPVQVLHDVLKHFLATELYQTMKATKV